MSEALEAKWLLRFAKEKDALCRKVNIMRYWLRVWADGVRRVFMLMGLVVGSQL